MEKQLQFKSSSSIYPNPCSTSLAPESEESCRKSDLIELTAWISSLDYLALISQWTINSSQLQLAYAQKLGYWEKQALTG